ncbi:MAG: class I SAM-dependent methyltransferase [Polyangiaceae bacterium]
MNTSNYTFGDSDQALTRLRWLSHAYEQATRDMLTRYAPGQVRHAVDLGCGPGFTTRLLHDVVKAERTTGLDSSARYIDFAAHDAPAAVHFLVHDVLGAPPSQLPPADLLLCRHLLAHVADLRAALAAFGRLASPGARLLIQETESLRSEHPALARYYECVSAMQAAHGQRTYVGGHLEQACEGSGFVVEQSRLNELEQDPRLMARLHRLNLGTWRRDERALELFDALELDALDATLMRIETGEDQASPVRNGLRELVLRLG